MTKFSFLCGINKYRSAPLRGCINDISDFSNELVKHNGFDAADVRLIADNRASHVEIVNRLTWLTKVAEPGDVVFYEQSGHGTQLASRSQQGEVDGLDEAFCPFDYDLNPSRLITDKVYNRIFSHFKPGVRLFWMSDSCHSGDLHRTSNPHDIIPRSYPLPVDIEWRNMVAHKEGFSPIGRKPLLNSQLEFVYIGACQAHQTAADAIFDGRANGAATYCFLEAMRAYRKDRVSARKLFETASELLQKRKFKQELFIDGPLIDAPFLA